jgi:hypothetical protein
MMHCWLLVLAVTARAADVGRVEPLAHPGIAEIHSRLIPATELSLSPVLGEAYEKPPFLTSVHFDDAHVLLPQAASPNRIASAASALAQRPADAPRVARTLEQALASGRPVSVLQFLPQMARELTGLRPEKGSEANCWNASLLWDGLAHGPHYTEDWEVQNAVESHFDPAQGRLRHGDLLAIHGIDHHDQEVLLHTARYVGHDLFWHKASSDDWTPWTLESLSNMTRPYLERLGKRYYDFVFKVHRPK